MDIFGYSFIYLLFENFESFVIAFKYSKSHWKFRKCHTKIRKFKPGISFLTKFNSHETSIDNLCWMNTPRYFVSKNRYPTDESNDQFELFICPYLADHKITAKRWRIHLQKCKANYGGEWVEWYLRWYYFSSGKHIPARPFYLIFRKCKGRFSCLVCFPFGQRIDLY